MSNVKTFPPVIPKPGLRPFAISITVLNLFGYCYLGFEPAPITPIISVLTAYFAELAVEVALRTWDGARFRGGWRNLVNFLLPAHITGLAVSMLLYTNENFIVVAFASSIAIFSKVFFRAPIPGAKGATIHFMNPSNFGIAVVLLLFHDTVSVVQIYQFTENLHGWSDWALPAFVVCTGSILNGKATKKWPVSAAWFIGFFLQALVRSVVSPAQPLSFLLTPMTGFAFIVFSFYMITDPATTPNTRKGQIMFGLSTAAVYGLLSWTGIVFGTFFALCIVCAVRGAMMWVKAAQLAQAQQPAAIPQPVPAAAIAQPAQAEVQRAV